MNCLTNICYVCLEKKDKSLITINTTLSVNEDMMHILGYLPFHLNWMKTKPIILLCEECCRRLRETYQFLIMCHKNSAVLQGYMARINTASNEAEQHVELNSEQDDISKIKCEINSEDEEIYTFEREPIIAESKYVFVNVEDAFVKEEDTWKMEAVDDKEASPMENNSTASSDNESHTEMAVTRNTHDTDTASGSSEARNTTNRKELNTPAKKSHKCVTCSKSFSKKSKLQTHTRVHTGEKPYKCATCDKGFSDKSVLVIHMRRHTGEKPVVCSVCKRCITRNSSLAYHMRTHTGEKPYKCSRCKKCFTSNSGLVTHMRTHTGEKPSE